MESFWIRNEYIGMNSYWQGSMLICTAENEYTFIIEILIFTFKINK